LQKQLLHYLGKKRQFSVIADSNKKTLAEHVQHVVCPKGWSPFGLEFYVSGDFSAATDTLKREVTAAIFDQIACKGVPWWMYAKGLKSLTDNGIVLDSTCYPKPTGIYQNVTFTSMSPRQTQTNGQLMGHILSFPILCIANYCAFHISVERYMGIPCSVQEVLEFCPVAINGDDILFRSNDKHYAIWRKVIAEFGFKLSLGKNFAHKEFFQINSQLFTERKDIFGETVGSDRQSYFNFGQLTGRKKGMGSEESMYGNSDEETVKELSSLRDNCLEILDGIPNSERMMSAGRRLVVKWVERRFSSLLNKKEMAAVLGPRSMGGLGLGGCPDKFNRVPDQARALFRVLQDQKQSFAYENFPRECAIARLTRTTEFQKERLAHDTVYQDGTMGFVLLEPAPLVREQATFHCDTFRSHYGLEW
jgi:hypothetical protein